MNNEPQSASATATKFNGYGSITKIKPFLKVGRIVVTVLLVLVIITMAISTYTSFVSTSGDGVPGIMGLNMLEITTDSMTPVLVPGDLVLETVVKDPGQLRKGDIITYWTVIDGQRVLNTHTIYEIYDGGGSLLFATKGENNSAVDPITVHESEIVGKYLCSIPALGMILGFFQTSTGFFILAVLLVLLIFLAFCFRRVYKALK